MDINKLRKLNPQLIIHNISDNAFNKYGKIYYDFDVTPVIYFLREHIRIGEKVTYLPSVENGEHLEIINQIKNSIYGGMPIQFGVCSGHNSMLNGMEYHKSSELNIMASDCVLFLGLAEHIYYGDKIVYNSKNAEIFYVPKGSMIELNPLVLHLAPLNVMQDGFIVAVFLPKGTNTPLEVLQIIREDRILKLKNKWLLKFMETGGSSEALIEGSNIKLLS
ncbi:MAG: DUF4867 family protein [Christensenellales bacterium]